MSSTDRFAQRIMRISGVQQYILARNDGQVMTHNVEDPDELAALVTLCGNNAGSVGTAMGFSPLKFILAARRNHGPMIIFPVDKYFLGIQQHLEAPQQEMIEEVQHVLRQVVSQRAKKSDEA